MFYTLVSLGLRTMSVCSTKKHKSSLSTLSSKKQKLTSESIGEELQIIIVSWYSGNFPSFNLLIIFFKFDSF
jgi:hypothetical protein